jgi:hypothetical protein
MVLVVLRLSGVFTSDYLRHPTDVSDLVASAQRKPVKVFRVFLLFMHSQDTRKTYHRVQRCGNNVV